MVVTQCLAGVEEHLGLPHLECLPAGAVLRVPSRGRSGHFGSPGHGAKDVLHHMLRPRVHLGGAPAGLSLRGHQPCLPPTAMRSQLSRQLHSWSLSEGTTRLVCGASLCVCVLWCVIVGLRVFPHACAAGGAGRGRVRRCRTAEWEEGVGG